MVEIRMVVYSEDPEVTLDQIKELAQVAVNSVAEEIKEKGITAYCEITEELESS